MKEWMNGRILVKTGRIEEQEVDAVVNAANSSLLGGGGVDGAIHRSGGTEILTQCREIRKNRYPSGLPAGEAVSTSAGLLKAKRVIHTVGPIYGKEQGREEFLLERCYRACFEVCRKEGLHSVAFPSISTGAYGFPKALAAKIAGKVIREELEQHSDPQRVKLVFFSLSDEEIFLSNCGWNQ